MEREVLYAEDGMVLTDGVHYGKVIFLANGADASEYYSITQEEYDKRMEEEEVSETHGQHNCNTE